MIFTATTIGVTETCNSFADLKYLEGFQDFNNYFLIIPTDNKKRIYYFIIFCYILWNSR